MLTFLQEASKIWRGDPYNLKLSIALPAGIVLPSETYYTYVDRVNLMSYDIFDGTGQYHADIKQVKKAVKTLIRSGCPKSKIILGIPGNVRACVFCPFLPVLWESNSFACGGYTFC